MATIGMDKLYYAKITEDSNGHETYGVPKKLAKAISGDISSESNEAVLHADDGVSESAKEFKQAKLTLGVDNLAEGVAEDLTGAKIDQNGVLISSSEDITTLVAVGWRAKKSNGKYRYFWLYRVQFSIPSTSLATKGDSITFTTPSIEGTVFSRNKPDANGGHPWKAEATEGENSFSAATIAAWYNSVYEPVYTDDSVKLSALSIGSLTLDPTFSASVTAYECETTNSTNTITATASDNSATIAITLNGNSITNGTSATWADGENTVEIKVTKGTLSKTYTVIVTKGE